MSILSRRPTQIAWLCLGHVGVQSRTKQRYLLQNLLICRYISGMDIDNQEFFINREILAGSVSDSDKEFLGFTEDEIEDFNCVSDEDDRPNCYY